MARFLITGGAGFIGSHLAELLLAGGHALRVIDNFETGQRANLDPRVDLIEGDIADRQAVARAVQDMDGVFHLAAIASVPAYETRWAASAQTNLVGSLSVFETCAAAGIPVVYASSAAVYGDCADLPLTEVSPTRPISGYGIDKLASEHHARAMADAIGLNAVGLRFFNVYGPRQLRDSAYSGVITIFLDRWLDGAPATIFGDGSQTRDFIYVADVARGLSLAMSHARSGRDGIFNICSGRTTAINDLVTALSACIGRPLPVEYDKPRIGDIHASYGSGETARRQLGFAAETGLQDGLRQTLAWAKAETVT